MAATPDGGEDPAWDEHTQVAGSQLLSQEGIYQLTQDLRSFSEGLTNLKAVFSDERDDLDVRVRVVAHQRLGELLRVLKYVINKYSELNSSAILSAAEGLINQVKSFNYETGEDNVSPEIFAAINNLALAFSSSVSECLVGDMNISPTRSVLSAPSLENISNSQKSSGYDPDTLPSDVNEQDIDAGISSQEPSLNVSHDNLDICFERSKAWSKYAGDLINYVKKKAHIENEYAKNLSKLSQQTRTILSEQSFLPFQSLYCTAIDQDREFASNSITTYQNLILAHKFIEPLQAKRAEHDRRHKNLRELWRKDKRWLDDAEANLKKAKQQYQARNQEYQKAKEAAIRAESEQNTQSLATEAAHSRQSSSGASGGTLFASVPTSSLTFPSSKMEKKKKQEEDTYLKASQAEHYYRACVNEANMRRRELGKREEENLLTLKDIMLQCEQTMKSVTAGYFCLHHQLYSPLPIQYQALQDDSKSYEPGFQYTEYLRHLVPQNDMRPDYKFEPYHVEGQMYFDNPNAANNLSLPLTHISDASPQTTRSHTGTRGISDTESSSSRSLDDLSPAASPSGTVNRKNRPRRDSNEGSISSNELLEDKDEVVAQNQASPESSPVPTQKIPKTLKNTIFNLRAFKGRSRTHKQSMFGVDFLNVANESPDGIPFILKKCITEIDNRALTTKGIYRVNGVKLRVEKLCSMLDSPNGEKTDLSEYSPRDISGVLKFFLRQLPEPLLLFRLYKEFLDIARQYQLLMKSSPDAHKEEPPPNEDFEEERVNSQVYEENSIKFNMILTAMHACVNKLPEPNRNTLQYIIAHLSRIAAHSEDNKMPASNLAIVFGPNLLRPAELVGNELQALMDLPAQSQVINMLILHRDIIFDTYSRQAHNEFRTISLVDNQPAPATSPDTTKDESEAGTGKQRGTADSSSSTLSSRSSELLTTTDQVLLNIDDTSLSNTRSSSTDDLLTSPIEDAAVTLPIQRSAYRDQNESSNNSNLSNESGNGDRMKVTTTDKRTILPDGSSITTTTNVENITTEANLPEPTKDSSPTIIETKPTSFPQESAPALVESSIPVVDSKETLPVIPSRKNKRRNAKEERHRKISTPLGPPQRDEEFKLKPPSGLSRHSFAAQGSVIVKTADKETSDDFAIKRKLNSGRQLPQVPVTNRRHLQQPSSMPGRTPPHHSKQLHTWNFPENLQDKGEGQKTTKKKESVVIREQDDEEVSFC